MHNLILGCLLDLCENPKTIHHVLTWRGKDNASAPHLFCEIFRKEEQELGVRRTQDGAISDPLKPLMGVLQEKQGVIPLPASNPSQSIVDVSENMRAKIYSIFGKIGVLMNVFHFPIHPLIKTHLVYSFTGIKNHFFCVAQISLFYKKLDICWHMISWIARLKFCIFFILLEL